MPVQEAAKNDLAKAGMKGLASSRPIINISASVPGSIAPAAPTTSPVASWECIAKVGDDVGPIQQAPQESHEAPSDDSDDEDLPVSSTACPCA